MNIRGEYWWIRQHANGVDWAYCVAGDPVPRQEGSCASITAVPAPAGDRVILCVPGERARIHKVNLPSANRKRVLAALPYALEDQLLHDIDSYHLVPLPAGNDTHDVPVVVVEHAWLSALLEQCKHAGWQPVLMVPDYLAVQAPEQGCWLVDATAYPLLLRMPGREGAALITGVEQQVPGVLLLALEQAARPPQQLKVRVADQRQFDLVSNWSAALADRNITLDLILDDLPRSSWLARQSLPDARLNLLTGPYAVIQPQWSGLDRLKTPLALVAALLLVSAIHWIIQGVRLQTEYDQLRQAIETAYRQAFPETRNLVDPRFQMEQQLASLKENGINHGAATGFLQRLDAVAALLETEPGCQLQQIGFDGSTLTLEVSVADYESLERLQQRLAGTAPVSIENAELKDGRVYGRIRVGDQA